MRREVLNLEFPPYCKEFTVHGYKFYRADDYGNRVQRLQHVARFQSEFLLTPNTGEHFVTGYVDIPAKEDKAIIPTLSGTSAPALNDILVLLSLFTGREVLAFSDPQSVIRAESNIATIGGILYTSLRFEYEGTLRERKEIGFEKNLKRIYEMVRNDEWKSKYRNGTVLILAREAFRARSPQSAYVQCWTIWEHLFSIGNQYWLSDEAISQMGSHEKINFILKEYLLTSSDLDEKSRRKIKDLSKMRNRLIHFGILPEKTDFNNVSLLLELTEQLIAVILGLRPSNVFNTMEKLEKFLKGEKSKT